MFCLCPVVVCVFVCLDLFLLETRYFVVGVFCVWYSLLYCCCFLFGTCVCSLCCYSSLFVFCF